MAKYNNIIVMCAVCVTRDRELMSLIDGFGFLPEHRTIANVFLGSPLPSLRFQNICVLHTACTAACGLVKYRHTFKKNSNTNTIKFLFFYIYGNDVFHLFALTCILYAFNHY